MKLRHPSSPSAASSRPVNTLSPATTAPTWRRSAREHFTVEYEADTDLRDKEQVPLKETGGIEAFFAREVLPHVSDAWIAKYDQDRI